MSTYINIDTFTPAVITTAEAKKYCRVDATSDDALIGDLILSAQEEALGFTHVIFGTATITLKVYAYTDAVKVPYHPLVTVDSLTLDGGLSTEYTVQGDTIYIDAPYEDEAVIVYSAGRDMPGDVKTALLQRVKFTYDFSDDLIYEKPRFFERVLFRYREPNTFQ